MGNYLNCFCVSDPHGHIDRYEKLAHAIAKERPSAVFLGGDLLPGVGLDREADFLNDYLIPRFTRMAQEMEQQYPAVFLILGNDDPRCEEKALLGAECPSLWSYIHLKKVRFQSFPVYGYAYVPPTPFRLKDWERYDVSRFVDVGSVSPEEGIRTVAVSENEIKWRTIQEDLELLAGGDEMDDAIMLFHSPPYGTHLDRAGLDSRFVEHTPLDVHVGSIAIRRFIENRQPLLTLHGHVHESARITGVWKSTIGRTVCINAAHDGPELALVRFDPHSPADATRELL
jgi:Icc-related predicted phosphoesterase